MRQWTLLAAASSLVIPTTSGLSQTSRERAVAIDRLEVPPFEQRAVEQIGPPFASPWSLAFLPDGSMLLSEKHGGIRHIMPDGRTGPALTGAPTQILQTADSGLHDIVLDPDFADNRRVYIAFAEGTEAENRLAIWQARFDGERLLDGRVIFRVGEAKKGPSHSGGRLLFLPDKTMLVSVGDGFDYRAKAQDPSSHLGKILRISREGIAPRDNPFVGSAGYAPEIWTLGHRNVQGLTVDSATGDIWAHEHGPRGGDEVNKLIAGANYGWPTVSSGIDYDGSLISERAHAPGLADSHFVWSPSIAPSGLAVYHGAAFPDWEGRFLVGALAPRSLVILRAGRETGRLVEQERILTGLRARIRDVRVAPDGNVYLLTDGAQGRLLRLLPAGSNSAIGPDSLLAPLAGLVGRWSGESVFTPAFTSPPTSRAETSETECVPILKASYIRCTTRYSRAEGRYRMVELHITRRAADQPFQVAAFSSNWWPPTLYSLTWDAQANSLTGLIPTENQGRPATERVSINLTTDGQTVDYRESLRLNDAPDDPWTETFIWKWKRRP